MSELTQQQVMVYERLLAGHDLVCESNRGLVGRANALLLASSVVIGVVVAARFLPDSTPSGFAVEYLLLGLVCLCSVVMHGFALMLWRGGLTMVPGTLSVDELYDDYIGQELDDAYYNLLRDLCGTIADNQALGMRLGRYLDGIVIGFISQLVFLFSAIAWGSLNFF